MKLSANSHLLASGMMLLTVSSAIGAPPPLPRGALSINVRQEQISSSGTNWRTAWGSFNTDYANKRVLIANVKRFGNFQPNITVSYYFIGRDLSTKKLIIYDSGHRQASASTAGTEILIVSPTVQSNRSRVNTPSRSAPILSSNGRYIGESSIAGKNGPTKVSGIAPHGWCLIVTQGDQEIAEAGSTPELIAWTKQSLRD